MSNVPAIRQSTALAERANTAIEPHYTIDDLKARAGLIVRSGLAPRGMTPEQLAVIMLKGQEIGLRPMEAMESLYVVNGKVGNYTHQLVSLLRQAGHDYRVVENAADRCKVIFYRNDGAEYEHTLTFKECQEAGWTGKDTWKGAGQRTMLAYRTISGGIRLHFPELVHQLPGRTAPGAQAPAPLDLADAWYTYTRQLLESEGLDGVLTLVRRLAESLGNDDEEDDESDGKGSSAGKGTSASSADPGFVDGEFTEHEDDPDPEEDPDSTPTRPYAPEVLRRAIQQRVRKGKDEPTTQQVRGATVGALEALFGAKASEVRPHMRHQLTQHLIGKPKSEAWTDGECRALLQWAQIRDDEGNYGPYEWAEQEAEAIVLAVDAANGQKELPL